MKINFTKKEKILWIFSLIIAVASNIVAGSVSFLNLIATIIGITAVLLCAKGNVWGQILIAIFSVLYGIISWQFRYWGELATYMGMSFPMALWSIYTWVKNPSKDNPGEVEIYRLKRKDYILLITSGMVITCLFFVLLRYLETPNIVFSTISITTSFFAAGLTMLRSSYYAFWYALNDLTLIVLWTLAAFTDTIYISMVVNFIVFFANDVYGFYSWKKRSHSKQLV